LITVLAETAAAGVPAFAARPLVLTKATTTAFLTPTPRPLV